MKRLTRRETVLIFAALVAAAAFARPASAAGSKHHKKRLLVSFKEGSTRAEREQAAKDMGLTLTDDIDSLQVSVLESVGDVAKAEYQRASNHPSVVTVEEDVYRNWLLESPSSFQAARCRASKASCRRWAGLGRIPLPRLRTPPKATVPALPRPATCLGAWPE